MYANVNNRHGIKILILPIVIILGITTYSFLFDLWFLIAVPVGFLFGFFLQKGDLCGSSAFSELLLLKNKSKILGLWIAIITSMAGLSVLDILGLVQLNPKPMYWMNYIVGGIIFGIGMVLAGGCVSGCLYKTGTGNINSMAGLVGIPIGIALVEYGPLNNIYLLMKDQIINNSDGSVITISTLTGLPFWLLSLIFITATLLFLYIKKNKHVNNSISVNKKNATSFLIRAWKPWIAGIGIGILVIPAYLSSIESGRNYPLGVTHGVLHVEMLALEKNLNHIYQKPVSSSVNESKDNSNKVQSSQLQGKKVSWWLILLVISVVVGSWISAVISGKARLLPKPPEQTVVAFFGGILVGTGAAFATGCVIGNIISGWALMSIGLFIFGIVTIITNWLTTYFYLMGGKIKNKLK